MKIRLCLLMIWCFTANATAQSRLDGTTFQASTYNFPGSVGVVRLVDTPDSNCESEAGSPVGDDHASETCLNLDSGTPPVTMTFGAGPQTIGGLEVTPTVTPFSGTPPDDPIVATNLATGDQLTLPTWSTQGEILEFTLRTSDNSFPSANDLDFWGFAATGIQYPNADGFSEIEFPFDEELGSYTNFYFWFEDENGPIQTGYEVFLPVGIGVGQHPLAESREAIYIFFSDGQVDASTDTPSGGSLDFYSHGSILDEDPEIGNLLFLADNVGVEDGFAITGMGFGILLVPPTEDSSGLLGDFDGDGSLAGPDIDLLSAQLGQPDAVFDLTGDLVVDEADRQFWVETLAQTFFGDSDLNGRVDFDDFVAMSNGFGSPGGWTNGDFDGSGNVQFDDFVLLSNHFGSTRDLAAASVPEPGMSVLAVFVVAAFGYLRRCRRAGYGDSPRIGQDGIRGMSRLALTQSARGNA